MSDTYARVTRALDDELISGSAEDVAAHLGISKSTARKYLQRMLAEQRATVRRTTSYAATTGRQTNVDEYSTTAEYVAPPLSDHERRIRRQASARRRLIARQRYERATNAST